MSPVKKIANASKDAPGATQIESLQGLLWWLVDKFGPGGVFIIAAWIMYGDQREDRKDINQMVRDATKAKAELASEMGRMNDTLDRIEDRL